MPDSIVRYCVVGVYWAHTPGSVQLLSAGRRVVVFDTVNQARDVVARLSGGRMRHWDASGEEVWFSPLAPDGYNHLAIITGYDPYFAPHGCLAMGIHSEAKGRDWRWHVHYSNVLQELLTEADRFGAAAFEAKEAQHAPAA